MDDVIAEMIESGCNADRIEALTADRDDWQSTATAFAAENARLTALVHAQAEEARQEIETRFWSVVDQNGLTGLPSDMRDALDRLVQRDIRMANPDLETGCADDRTELAAAIRKLKEPHHD